MKLRALLKAEVGHSYRVMTFNLRPTKPVSYDTQFISRSDTELRMGMNECDRYEQQLSDGSWEQVEETYFKETIRNHR